VKLREWELCGRITILLTLTHRIKSALKSCDCLRHKFFFFFFCFQKLNSRHNLTIKIWQFLFLVACKENHEGGSSCNIHGSYFSSFCSLWCHCLCVAAKVFGNIFHSKLIYIYIKWGFFRWGPWLKLWYSALFLYLFSFSFSFSLSVTMLRTQSLFQPCISSVIPP